MNIFDTRNNFEWRDYVKIFMRRKWFFIVPFVLVLSVGIASILAKRNTYESYAIIQIKASKLPNQLAKLLPGVTGIDAYRDWKKQFLSSNYLIHVIKTVGLNKEEEVISDALEMQAELPDKSLDEIINFLLIRKLRDNIRIKQYENNMVEIRCSYQDPDKAHQIVKTLIEYFRKDFLENEVTSIQSAIQFSSGQIDEFKAKLQAAEERLNEFRKKMVNEQFEDQLLTMGALQRINDGLTTAEMTVREKRDLVMNLSGRLGGVASSNSLPMNFTIRKMLSDIDQKVQDEAELLKTYLPNSAEVLRVRHAINQLRDNLENEFQREIAQNNSRLDNSTRALLLQKYMTMVDLRIAEKRRDALQQILDSSRIRSSTNQSYETTLAKLEEEVKLNRSIYNLLLQQAQGTQIEEAMQRANAASRIAIIEPPSKPLEPSDAGKRMLAFITLVVATVMGIIAVYLREYFDGTLQTVEETEEYFNLLVLCVLPYLEKDQIKDRNTTDTRVALSELEHLKTKRRKVVREEKS